MNYRNYRIVKFTNKISGNTQYKIQTDQSPPGQWIVNNPMQIGVADLWHTLIVVNTIEQARDTLNLYKYGLSPGEEIVT